MANSFGTTWWGQQWLDSLDRLEYTRSLVRGRALAKKGAVKFERIDQTWISAKVQDTRKTPYRVTFSMPSYTREDTEEFVREVGRNPLIINKLMNRELPIELYQITEQCGIKLFPASWTAIQMHCDCREWTRPCRHEAAILYAFSHEIDKNPFNLLKVRGFDIFDRLRNVIDRYQPFFSLSRITLEGKKLPEFICNEAAYEQLDFSIIPELGQQIVELYPSKTMFFGGNFQALLSHYYKSQTKNFAKEEASDIDVASLPMVVRNSQIFIGLALDGKPVIGYQYAQESLQPLDIEKLIALLKTTSYKRIFSCSLHFRALYFIFHYCRRLLRQGAILPQMVVTDRQEHRIRWIPALINNQVKTVFDLLLEITPTNLCQTEEIAGNGRVTTRYLPAEENLNSLCAMFLDHFFKSDEVPNSHLGTASAVGRNTKIAQLFFCHGTQSFHRYSEADVPEAILLWLNRVNLVRKSFVPVLAIDEFANHFECQVLVENNERPLEPPVELHEFVAEKGLQPKHKELIRDLAMLADCMPELKLAIESTHRSVVRFDNLTIVELLEKTLPALELYGIRILLPKSLRRILRPQVSMKIRRSDRRTYFSLNDLLAFDWRVAFGDQLLTEEEFNILSKSAGRLIRLKDSYALMTEGEMKRVIKSLSVNRDVSSLHLLQSVLSDEYDGARVEIDESLRQEIRNLLKEEDVSLPQGLQATLRPYQQRGFNWMYKNARLGLGSVLADDMGLGKTLQVIATILKFKEEGRLKKPALVVAPTTLLINWEKEIRKFAPSLTNLIYHGSGRAANLQAIDGIDIVLTSYGLVRSDTQVFKKTVWSTLVIDEAQNIKNNETAQTKAIKQIKSKVKIAMSGTPVENRLSEYWSIFDFSNTGYLGTLSFFNEKFSKPIEVNRDRKKLENFRKITQPFILRREKSDKSIIDDLPEKIENNSYCSLSPEQISLYNATVENNLRGVENSDGIKRQAQVLTLLNSLKQICNHPSHFLKKEEAEPSLSGKTEMLFHLLDNIYEAGEKTLIFSQYAEMGILLSRMISQHYGKKAAFLHGTTSLLQREKMVEDFQNQPDIDTFILSLKAGGTGLNLTAAANVIHYDLWWNPAAETQATDRAFRIGQQKNVMVYRLITKNTLEEKIDHMIQDKKELANLTVARGESWIGNLTDKELKELIMLGY
jgi:SNF2 family DNA or RNA helicase